MNRIPSSKLAAENGEDSGVDERQQLAELFMLRVRMLTREKCFYGGSIACPNWPLLESIGMKPSYSTVRPYHHSLWYHMLLVTTE